MQRNRVDLMRLLSDGVRVYHFDHHAAGELSPHPGLDAYIDEASVVCTYLLVDRHLGRAHRAWALVGIYGDKLGSVADRLELRYVREPGDCAGPRRLYDLINDNAYGEQDCDVCIMPACFRR